VWINCYQAMDPAVPFGGYKMSGYGRESGKQHVEAAIAAAAAAGSGIVIRGGAAKGAPAEGKQEGLQWERWQAAKLEDLLGDLTPMEFILRFTFTNPDLDTTIVGTANPAHLKANVEILQQGPLPPDLYAEAKRRLAAAGSVPQGI
jgi:aryl-alcohol dehydrogenase-like predicted oxidoreductase